MVMNVKSADGVSIAYQVVGSGQPALVFVHGWCCDQSYWDSQVPYFSQRYKVVTIDLAGHGDSGLNRRTWTMAEFGNDVVAVVKELDLDRVVLIGHSMGGFVVAEAERRMPKRVIGLVGADTFHKSSKYLLKNNLTHAWLLCRLISLKLCVLLSKTCSHPVLPPSLLKGLPLACLRLHRRLR